MIGLGSTIVGGWATAGVIGFTYLYGAATGELVIS